MPIDFGLFTWKNKAEREEELAVYAEWAFPSGQQQKENLEALLRSLFPKEEVTFTLIKYLTCKELYEKEYNTVKDRYQALDRVINQVRKFKKILKPTDMPVYLALVLASEDLDESLEYPSVEAIRDREVELGILRTGK